MLQRTSWLSALLVFGALAAGGQTPSPQPIPDPTPTPSPDPTVTVQVFHDDFTSGSTYASYQALGGATVTAGKGVLAVSVPPGSSDSGFQMALPPGGTGVRCVKFDGWNLPPSDPGATSLTWTWLGYDDLTGAQVVVLETTIENGIDAPLAASTKQAVTKTIGFTIRHRKANGTLVIQTVPKKNWDDVKSYKWDTRRSGTQVMLEIEFKDGTRYNSAWIDPSASTMAAFQVRGTVPSYSLATVDGAEYHVDTAQTATVAAFDTTALNKLSHYFLGQTDDSDLVVMAAVKRVDGSAAPVAGDPRPRLRVVYEVRQVLRGKEADRRIVVFHALDRAADAAQWQPGRRFLLYLERGDGASGQAARWYFDYGRPTGVVRFSPQNLAAVESRIANFYSLGAADEKDSVPASPVRSLP